MQCTAPFGKIPAFRISNQFPKLIDIQAVNLQLQNTLFAASKMAGKHIYERSSSAGKRVQCNNGAKNHCIVLPDANKNKSISQIVGAAFGAAGQRCMALSVAVFVGAANGWIPEIVDVASRLKVNAGHINGADLGPVISPESKRRIIDLIQSGVEEGASLSLDGRGIVVPDFKDGNFVGPTILTSVKVRP
ncbi:hypothetical protein QAD02_002409 [Eretmocerus hayati]|uniref:Uncharacterized protein n=1 Tax=Eretmocerus hayati TaxID=131215 RepID=A0ACC2NJ05_9HYME|nr:hypothetical protein QAD02_002409 [Eretmocerus hayati]